MLSVVFIVNVFLHNIAKPQPMQTTPVARNTSVIRGVVCTKRLAILHSHTWYYNGMQHSTTTAETSTTGTTHGFSTSSTKISTTQIAGWWSVQCCCAMGLPSGSSSSQGDRFQGKRRPGYRSQRRRRAQVVLQPHSFTQNVRNIQEIRHNSCKTPLHTKECVLNNINVQTSTLPKNHKVINERNS